MMAMIFPEEGVGGRIPLLTLPLREVKSRKHFQEMEARP